MKDRIETIIRDWLVKEFKNPNAIPGPMLKGLAEEIDNHRWEIFSFTKDEYDKEEIEMIAKDKEIELTNEELKIVLNKYHDSDYQDTDTIDYLVDRIIEMRKENI